MNVLARLGATRNALYYIPHGVHIVSTCFKQISGTHNLPLMEIMDVYTSADITRPPSTTHQISLRRNWKPSNVLTLLDPMF